MELLSPEFIELIGNAGLSVVLALVVIYWYRSDSQAQLNDEKQKVISEREDKLMILNVIKENTNAISSNTGAIERVMDICNKINDKISGK